MSGVKTLGYMVLIAVVAVGMAGCGMGEKKADKKAEAKAAVETAVAEEMPDAPAAPKADDKPLDHPAH